MADPVRIPIPVPYLGFVNLWLLEGQPLTLIDAGPANAQAAEALDAGLAAHGHTVDQIELLLITHHHLDHAGLAQAVKDRSGATIAAHRTTAQWGSAYHERARQEHRFSEALLRAHGVPEELLAGTRPFFEHIIAESRDFATDRVLSDGETIEAGGRRLRVVYRPGHSTTDTLFIDDDSGDAFVGDHLLANTSSGAELMPTELPGEERRRALLDYLGNLRKTEVMQIARCYPGHGPVIDDHRALIEERLAFHSDRLDRIAALVADGHSTAFSVARRLWSDDVAETQPVLVVWEVLGHLDILVNRGTIKEDIDEAGHRHFRPKEAIRLAQR